MPVSQGAISSGLEGHVLVAWASFNSAGALVKSAGFSAASRPTNGQYSFTFSTPRANTNYIVRKMVDSENDVPLNQTTGGRTVNGFAVNTFANGVLSTQGPLHVAVYE